MIVLPQLGGCLCGEIRYQLDEEPLTLYACHCTDCRRQTGTSFSLSMVVRGDALQLVRGQPREYSLELADGRRKRSSYCGRCSTRLWGPSRVPGLAVLEPGSLDDSSRCRPAGHIWTRSAQRWLVLPEDALQFAGQPSQDDFAALVRAWKEQQPG